MEYVERTAETLEFDILIWWYRLGTYHKIIVALIQRSRVVPSTGPGKGNVQNIRYTIESTGMCHS